MLKQSLRLLFINVIVATCVVGTSGCTYTESDDDCEWCNRSGYNDYGGTCEYIACDDYTCTYDDCVALNLDCGYPPLPECDGDTDCPWYDTGLVDTSSDADRDSVSSTDSDTVAVDTVGADTMIADIDTATTDSDIGICDPLTDTDSSCDPSSTDDTSACPKGDCGDVCGNTLTGTCIPLYCVEDVDCGVAKTCSGGQCHFECTQTTECPTGQICEEAVCIDNPNPERECVYNEDCGDMMFCVNATCFSACDNDDNCGALEMCIGGMCRPDPRPGPECLLNSDCIEDCEICVNGQCELF